MPSPPSVIEVAAGLVFRGGRLLITQRHQGSHLGGLWEFPGGKREPGETYEVCLARELREELGIEIEIRDLIEELLHEYAEKTVRLRFFRCLWREHEPSPIDCAALAWVTAEELRRYPFPDADAQLLERLQREPDWW